MGRTGKCYAAPQKIQSSTGKAYQIGLSDKVPLPMWRDSGLTGSAPGADNETKRPCGRESQKHSFIPETDGGYQGERLSLMVGFGTGGCDYFVSGGHFSVSS